MDYEEDTEVDIEKSCYNCVNSMKDDDIYPCDECLSMVGNKPLGEHFIPRKDLVELHGKLRKAVKALRKIKDSDAGCEILWQAKDTDGSWYDVHVDDYVDEVLEELQ